MRLALSESFLNARQDTGLPALADLTKLDWIFSHQEGVNAQRTHSSLLLPMLAQCLAQNSLTMADVTQIAVNLGPGSFTGIRSGLSVVRAFGQFLPKVQIYPFNAFEQIMACYTAVNLSQHASALVSTASGTALPKPALASQVWIQLDARNQTAYCAQYAAVMPRYPNEAPVWQCVTEPAWITAEAAQAQCPPGVFKIEAKAADALLASVDVPEAMRSWLARQAIKPVQWADLMPLYLQPPRATVKTMRPEVTKV